MPKITANENASAQKPKKTKTASRTKRASVDTTKKKTAKKAVARAAAPSKKTTARAPRKKAPSKKVAVAIESDKDFGRIETMDPRQADFPAPVDPEGREVRAGRSVVGSIGLFFLEFTKIAVLAVITIGIVRFYLFKPFYVKGQSMYPTYQESEYLIVDLFSPRFREYERGDVVVFEAPVGEKDFYLKRVIGLPGEQIKIDNNKVIVCNDAHPQCTVIEENYLIESTGGSVNVTLGPGEYYVLGDNRDQSFDSRQFGPVTEEDIIGKTLFRGWPFSRITTFATPEYNL